VVAVYVCHAAVHTAYGDAFHCAEYVVFPVGMVDTVTSSQPLGAVYHHENEYHDLVGFDGSVQSALG
jgi:hypothetical protein